MTQIQECYITEVFIKRKKDAKKNKVRHYFDIFCSNDMLSYIIVEMYLILMYDLTEEKK